MLRRLALIAAGLIAAWLAACLVLFVWAPAGASPPAHADAVIVLSGGLDRRLDPALELMRRHIASVLAISGAVHDPKWRKAQRLCRRTPATGGYRVICFQPTPFSTRGEARAIARLARERGWTRIVVVTSQFHVTRAKLLVRRCYAGGLWVVGTGSPLLRLPEEWASETGKLLVQLTVRRGC